MSLSPRALCLATGSRARACREDTAPGKRGAIAAKNPRSRPRLEEEDGRCPGRQAPCPRHVLTGTRSPERGHWHVVPSLWPLAHCAQHHGPNAAVPSMWSPGWGPQRVVPGTLSPASRSQSRSPWHTVPSVMVPTMRSPARGPRLAGQAGARRAGLREHPPDPRGRRRGGQLPFTALTRGTSSQGR